MEYDEDDLHPWGIICSSLFELSSDDVCNIIGLTGLQVDWRLEGGDAYSHTTRKRAYLPRLQYAYSNIPEEKKLLVAWIVGSELAKRDEKFIEKMNSRLKLIGWKIEPNGLTPIDVNIREIFFPKGTQHDAYIEIKNIIKQAEAVLEIIDPYIDGTIFQILKTFPLISIQIKLLSSKLPSDFAHEAQKFLDQYPHFTLEVKTTREFHDRFIIIDESKCYHIGASIKDAGNKVFMISQIEDPNNISALVQKQRKCWEMAEPVKI